LLQAKLEALHRWDAPAVSDFNKWFGKTDEPARQKIVGRIERCQTLLRSYGEANFRGAGVDNQADLYAFVHPEDDQHVYLGNLWATSPLTGQDSQASTLAHEMSHFDSVDATNDHEYGVPKSKGLAKNDPNKAIDNADNFLYYLDDAP
jgi:peptidyl-Lys metalloendopeptidase